MEDGAQELLAAAGIVLLIGGVFAAIGLVRARLRQGWTRTTGEVVGARPGRNGQYPIFRWRDAAGGEHQHVSAVSSRPAPRVGREVPVLYDPQAPHRGMIDSVVQRGTIFTIVGGLLVAVAAGLAAVAVAL